jgi:hypothetical protein
MTVPSRGNTIRVLRLLAAAAVLATGLAAALAAPAAPVPAAPVPALQPAAPSCAPGDGVEITAEMVQAVAVSDGHAAAAPAGQSVSAGCASGHTEEELGWSTSAPDTPQNAALDESDDSDPFAPHGGGLYYYAYQLTDLDGNGLPQYWEPPTALHRHIAEWPANHDAERYVWRDRSTGAIRTAWLPTSSDCRYYHETLPANEAPGRVAAYRAEGHPKIYLYDHVPLPRAARRFKYAGGGWSHFMCGVHTPGDIAGPGNRLTSTEAVYYSTPHWVYARGWTPAQLTLLAPIWRAARVQTQLYDEVRTSPAARAVVAQKVWMWGPPAGYDIELGSLRALVKPTGIVVRAPGVPMHVHDLRDGGCRDGGQPDTGDPRADTDCYFVFDRSTGPDPAATYTVGFALRWSITTTTTGGTLVGEPMTFWTTSVRQFQVGEVQVAVR